MVTNEEDLNKLLEKLIGSIFRNDKEIDKARKQARLKLLTQTEKEKIKEFLRK